MEFRCYDCHGKQLASNELPQLQIWNPTMEHILANAMEKLRKEETSGPDLIAEE